MNEPKAGALFPKPETLNLENPQSTQNPMGYSTVGGGAEQSQEVGVSQGLGSHSRTR